MTVAADESLGTIDAAPAPADSVAAPGAIPYQAVSDHELERFDIFFPPIPVAAAGVFAGVFLATVTGAIGSLFAIGGEGIGLGDALLLTINALSLGVAVTAAAEAAPAEEAVAFWNRLVAYAAALNQDQTSSSNKTRLSDSVKPLEVSVVGLPANFDDAWVQGTKGQRASLTAALA